MFEEAETPAKRKRRPAGTPDPEAEVVALRAETLLESDRYVCEICNQGFQREQNLQMHRRRHKVPWKLVKRAEVRKRVFVCPEPSCLHHQPSHALGDLVGIKKHFRRKHSTHKHWICHKCSKAYAVHSDFKAHLKTCGTRGHSCDCGRVFSRVESFIEHQDSCTVRRVHPGDEMASSSSPPLLLPMADDDCDNHNHNLELQLLPSCEETRLKLSIGGGGRRPELRTREEQLKVAAADKAHADEARQQARKQVETAEMELAKAKRMRQEAQAELHKAHLLRDQATKRITSTIMQITCHTCKHHFHFHAPDHTYPTLEPD